MVLSLPSPENYKSDLARMTWPGDDSYFAYAFIPCLWFHEPHVVNNPAHSTSATPHLTQPTVDGMKDYLRLPIDVTCFLLLFKLVFERLDEYETNIAPIKSQKKIGIKSD